MTVAKTSQLALAAAAAAMFTLAPTSASLAEDNVKCMGVNACKGQSACKTAASGCKGMNSCKGKGFLLITESACKQQGGTVG